MARSLGHGAGTRYSDDVGRRWTALVFRALLDIRRAESRRLDGHNSGHFPNRRRSGSSLFRAQSRGPLDNDYGRRQRMDRTAERLPYDPRRRRRLPPQHDNPRRNGRFRSGHRATVRHFERPAGTRAAVGVDLGHQYRLLGIQPIYHSEGTGGPFAARSKKGSALCRLPETPHPADRRHSRHHGLCTVHQSPPDPRAAGFDHHGRQRLSVAVEELHTDGYQGSGLRRSGRRDRLFARQHDQQHGHDFHHGHLQTADLPRSLGKTAG